MATLAKTLEIFGNPPSWVVPAPPPPALNARQAGGSCAVQGAKPHPEGRLSDQLGYTRISPDCIGDLFGPLEDFDGDWGDRGWGASAVDCKFSDVLPVVEISANGMRVSQRISSAVKIKVSSRRSVVMGLSSDARRRMCEFLSSVDWGQITASKHISRRSAFFFTLTYADSWGKNPLVWKQHLENFFYRVQYRFPSVGFVWRLEFQKRGAPHFHIICNIGDRKIAVSEMRVLVRKLWAGVIKKDENEADDVRGLFGSGSSVSAYVSKYCGKDDSQNHHVPSGRCWGVWGSPPNCITLKRRKTCSNRSASFQILSGGLSEVT